MDDKDTLAMFLMQGYQSPKRLASGEWAAIYPYGPYFGLLVGMSWSGHRACYAFPSWATAKAAIDVWRGIGDPPGPWSTVTWVGPNGKNHQRINPFYGHLDEDGDEVTYASRR